MWDLLVQELENKKTFDAMYDTSCDACGEDIAKDDEFTFFGDKKKVCNNCFENLLDQIKEKI